MATKKAPAKKKAAAKKSTTPKAAPEAKPPTREQAFAALSAQARKNTRSRSAAKRYPRYNGKVIELAPPPKFGKRPPSRTQRLNPLLHDPKAGAKEPTVAEKRTAKRALDQEIKKLVERQVETAAYQQEVAKVNRKRERDAAKPPKPLKLKVRVKTEPIKVIVLRSHSHRRPCGAIPLQFQGLHTVASSSPMFTRNGSFPPAYYTDSVPLPSLSIDSTSWLSPRCNAELERMLKDMRSLSQRCMQEINERAKANIYHCAAFPELRRRLVLSLIQELRENL